MVFSRQKLASFFDHTLLKPSATASEIEKLCTEAVQFSFFGVCVNPCFVSLCAGILRPESVKVVTVCGFPLGANCTGTKVEEARRAVKDGADEVDMVMNMGAFKDRNHDVIRLEVREVVHACAGKPVKVILETALLSDPEVREASLLCVESGAAFVKTSTGFGPGGASARAVEVMREAVGPDLGVKASGGISSLAQVRTMIHAGANRIGASASVAILRELEQENE